MTRSNKDNPYSLRPGDVVAAVLPAGPPDVDRFNAGVAFLEKSGFGVHKQPGAELRKNGYLAGTDEERAQEFIKAYTNDAVRAVWCGRGGYGTMRILQQLEEVVRSAPPKLVIGFSDVTAIGCMLWRHDIPWLHAPLLTSVAAEPEETQKHCLAIAAGDARGLKLQGKATITPGRCQGRLLGGSLSLLSALCGTPYMPDLTGAILFIEDVGERAYRLDRMWQQLVLSGALHGVCGIVLGHLTQCEGGLEALTALIAEQHVPSASGFAFGHEAPNFAVPFGADASFDANAQLVTFDSDVVKP